MMPGGAARRDADGALKLIEAFKKDPGFEKALKAVVAADDASRKIVAGAAEVSEELAAERKAVDADRTAVDADIRFVQQEREKVDKDAGALLEREDTLSEAQRTLAKDRRDYKVRNEEAGKLWAESDKELKTREADMDSLAEALNVRQDRIAERETVADAARDRQADIDRQVAEIRAG